MLTNALNTVPCSMCMVILLDTWQQRYTEIQTDEILFLFSEALHINDFFSYSVLCCVVPCRIVISCLVNVNMVLNVQRNHTVY